MTMIAAFSILIFFSFLAFRWPNPVLWMLVFADAFVTGLYTPNLICGISDTTPLGLTVGFLILAYALFAAGMAFREMFAYDE